MLRRRRDAEEEASGETEERQSQNAGVWVGVDTSGGVYCCLEDGGRGLIHRCKTGLIHLQVLAVQNIALNGCSKDASRPAAFAIGRNLKVLFSPAGAQINC